MISRTITYTDFNEESHTETLWFHLSRDTMFDNLDLEDNFQALLDKFEGETRELTKPEAIEILQLVKRLFKLSYGVRSEDGSRFRQNEEVWQDFKDSAAYDAALWDLFSKPEDAIAFMGGIMPKDLREEAAKAIAEQERKAPQDHLPKHVEAPKVAQNVFDENYTEEVQENDLTGMDDEQFRELVKGRDVTDLSKDEMTELIRRSQSSGFTV